MLLHTCVTLRITPIARPPTAVSHSDRSPPTSVAVRAIRKYWRKTEPVNGCNDAASTPAMPPTMAARPQFNMPIWFFEIAMSSATVLSSAIALVCRPRRVNLRNAPMPTTTSTTAHRLANCCQLTLVPSTEKLPVGKRGTAALTSKPQTFAASAAKRRNSPNVRMIRLTGVARFAYRKTNSSDARPMIPTSAIVSAADHPTGQPHS